MKFSLKAYLVIPILLCSNLAISAENAYSLRLIGDYTIKTGTIFEREEFGGISSIDRLPNGDFLALSDERGGGHGGPRFYSLSIKLDTESIKQVTINNVVHLKYPDGSTLPSSKPTIDPEGLRVAPNGNLYISSEGNWNENPLERYQPLIGEFKTDGSLVRVINTSIKFNYADNKTSGARDNKVFESIAVTPSGQIFTANEDALIDDGNAASAKAGSLIRVVKIDPSSDQPAQEYAYELPKISLDETGKEKYPPGNGLVELLALSENEFIAVERAYVDGVGITVNLIKAKIEKDTTNISAFNSLINKKFKPMERKMLLSMPVTYHGIRIDNIEGISLGPVLRNGNQTLILVSDNNFDENQVTQFLAFELLGSPPLAAEQIQEVALKKPSY